ncbi:MAG: EamA family transporter [Opitutales bacterium]
MAIEWYHILPLLAGLAYAMSAVCSKRALVEGAGMMRLIVATNGFTVLTILLLLFIQEAQVDWSQWGYPVMAGVTFFGAQSCTFLAIRFGDVSIQTPIMGTKIVFVALAVSLFGTALVDTLLWLCAFISAAAVFLLGFSGWGRPKETVISIVLALAASLAFTAADFQMASNTTKFSTALAPFLFEKLVDNALLSLEFV